MQIPLTEVKGVGPTLAKDLAAHGINSAEDLAAAALGKLSTVHGISDTRAIQVKQAATDLIRSRGASASKKAPAAKPAPVVEAPSEVDDQSEPKAEKKKKKDSKDKKGKDKKDKKDKKKDKKKAKK